MSKATKSQRAATSRAEFDAVLASTHDAIVTSTREGVITSWNPAAETLYGYRAEEVIGRNTDVLEPHDRRDEAAKTLQRIVAGEPPEHRDTTRLAKGGSRIDVAFTTSGVCNPADSVVGIVMLSRRSSGNIGEPALLDDARREQRQGQLEQAQRMEVLGRLAGGVAHDFNNLLAVILNYASLVSEDLAFVAESPQDPAQRLEVAQRDVGQITRAAQRAADLTRQLLAFARREVVQSRIIDLNEVVDGVEELLRRTIGEDVELIVSRADTVWSILADPGQIEQILVNLTVNARDAMPRGGILRIDTANVTVESDSVAGGSPARPGRYVRLRVSDTGSGMSEEVVSHAFEPFYTTKRDGAGTGLGLATVYGIVTQAEATIAIQSELGAGTTFTLLLPVSDEVAAAIEEPVPYSRTPKGETVLVVEDEDALRDVTERIFTRNGYRVITASNGADALSLAARYEGEIHLLVTDVVMPQMLGKEAAERIRELRPDIEVLYMSGYAQPVLASQGRLEPGVILVDKPFSEAALLAKAGQVLNGHFQGFRTSTPEPGTTKDLP